MTPNPATNGSPATPLDRVLRLLARCSDHELYWLKIHGIPGIQRDRKGIVVVKAKEDGHAEAT